MGSSPISRTKYQEKKINITKVEVKAHPESFLPIIAFEGYVTLELVKDDAMSEEEAIVKLGKDFTEQVKKFLNNR